MLRNNVLVSAFNTMPDNKAPAKKKYQGYSSQNGLHPASASNLSSIYCFDSHCNKILNRNVIVQIYLYSIAWLEEGKKLPFLVCWQPL